MRLGKDSMFWVFPCHLNPFSQQSIPSTLTAGGCASKLGNLSLSRIRDYFTRFRLHSAVLVFSVFNVFLVMVKFAFSCGVFTSPLKNVWFLFCPWSTGHIFRLFLYFWIYLFLAPTCFVCLGCSLGELPFGRFDQFKCKTEISYLTLNARSYFFLLKNIFLCTQNVSGQI